MMLARCPECATTFRVTSEQLQARGGKVRCGQCRQVFNGLDALLDGPRDKTRPDSETASVTTFAAPSEQAPHPAAVDEAREPIRGHGGSAEPPLAIAEPIDEPIAASAPAAEPQPDAAAAASDEVVRQEAQAAGLVAVRETRDVPGYSKWAERPLASRETAFDAPPRHPRWPSMLVALLLTLGLLAQITYHSRGDIAARWPETRPWLLGACSGLGCDVPLPRQADLISIEGSELQSDPAHGDLLVLQATLRNRAAFAQAYPALELTLTDTGDSPVVRRVLQPADYLAAKSDPAAAFAANADLALKLWVDARDAGAAGYRLYVFYP